VRADGDGVVNHDEYVAAIRRDGAVLADAARRAGTDARVPSCPLWSVSDLLGHIGRLHRWVAQITVDHATERGSHWSETEPPPDDERIDWFAAGVPLLADALANAGPDLSLWSWTSDETSGFWARRQANETAMHRFDAQLAAGETTPIERVLAVDGINELFDLIPFWPLADRVRGAGERLHFHCTDGDGEWLARLSGDGLVVTREHAKGDVAARGTASDLLLFLYGRAEADSLDIFGDAALLARWRELVTW
jgi:uncharacterized protein (TIGR03083 family)